MKGKKRQRKKEGKTFTLAWCSHRMLRVSHKLMSKEGQRKKHTRFTLGCYSCQKLGVSHRIMSKKGRRKKEEGITREFVAYEHTKARTRGKEKGRRGERNSEAKQGALTG